MLSTSDISQHRYIYAESMKYGTSVRLLKFSRLILKTFDTGHEQQVSLYESKAQAPIV